MGILNKIPQPMDRNDYFEFFMKTENLFVIEKREEIIINTSGIFKISFSV